MTSDDRGGAHILLVEDSPADARLTGEALREAAADVRVTWLEDGEKALAYLRGDPAYPDATRPDLVLLDLNMPRLDGRELLQCIKTDKKLSSVPVVVLTSSASEADVLESYQQHANAYITKATDLDAFVADLKTLTLFWENVCVPGRRPSG